MINFGWIYKSIVDNFSLSSLLILLVGALLIYLIVEIYNEEEL